MQPNCDGNLRLSLMYHRSGKCSKYNKNPNHLRYHSSSSNINNLSNANSDNNNNNKDRYSQHCQSYVNNQAVLVVMPYV